MDNYVSPENFLAILVRPSQYLPFGETGPYKVVGIKNEDGADTVIVDGIPNKQLAAKFIDVYLTKCIKENYFSRIGDC